VHPLGIALDSYYSSANVAKSCGECPSHVNTVYVLKESLSTKAYFFLFMISLKEI
jgi:hypothetical protein